MINIKVNPEAKRFLHVTKTAEKTVTADGFPPVCRLHDNDLTC